MGKQTSTTLPALEQLLTIDDVAELLRLPVATLYSYRSRREGPRSFRVGRWIRYRQEDVAEWIEARLQQSGPGTSGTAPWNLSPSQRSTPK
jgi:predicted DNA-binding transcriptional regulator AlpA